MATVDMDMDMDMADIMEEDYYMMNIAVLEVVQCKPSVTMESVDADLDMTLDTDNAGKTSMISMVTTGMNAKDLVSIHTSLVQVMMFVKELT